MTLLQFADPRDLDYFAPQDGLSWSAVDGQDSRPGCLALSGANDDPAIGVLPTYRFEEFDASVNGGNNTVEFYFNVRDSSQTAPVRLLWYRDAGVADGQTNDEPTLLMTINRALASSTVRLQARNDGGSYPYASDTLNRNQWHKVTLDFDHQGAICTVDISINDSLYLAGHVCEGNYAIGKFAIESQDAAADVLFDDLTTDAAALSKEAYTPLDPTKDTPYGRFYEGEDITLPLQWAATNMKPISEGGHGRSIKMPPGTWRISEKITFPYRNGGKFLGAGCMDPTSNSAYWGVATVLQWTGADDGTSMLKFTGGKYEIGDFTCYASGYSNAKALAYGRPSGANGIGSGKSEFRPLHFIGFDVCVQLREDGDHSNNTDNLIFDTIEATLCGTVIEMNGEFVFDIAINKMHIGVCDYGIYVKGGGHVHVAHALFTHPNEAALYIEANSLVTWKCGKYVFDNVKVDDQATSAWTFLKSYQKYNHQVHLNSAIISVNNYVGLFAHIEGRCVLTIGHCMGSFNKIEGAILDGVTPVCILNETMMQDTAAEMFDGDIKVRVRDCTEWSNNWRDPDPLLAAANS